MEKYSVIILILGKYEHTQQFRIIWNLMEGIAVLWMSGMAQVTVSQEWFDLIVYLNIIRKKISVIIKTPDYFFPNMSMLYIFD